MVSIRTSSYCEDVIDSASVKSRKINQKGSLRKNEVDYKK